MTSRETQLASGTLLIPAALVLRISVCLLSRISECDSTRLLSFATVAEIFQPSTPIPSDYPHHVPVQQCQVSTSGSCRWTRHSCRSLGRRRFRGVTTSAMRSDSPVAVHEALFCCTKRCSVFSLTCLTAVQSATSWAVQSSWSRHRCSDSGTRNPGSHRRAQQR